MPTVVQPVEVFTTVPTPFAFGGTEKYIKTLIDDYELIPIGMGFSAFVFHNPIRDFWHIAESISGALICTEHGKDTALQKVLDDVKSGDKKQMERQVKEGLAMKDRAELISREDFFSKFKHLSY